MSRNRFGIRDIDMVLRTWADFFPPFTTSYSFGGSFVDTDRYNVIDGELIPRKSYQDALLRQKEEELKSLDEYYERRKKELQAEKDNITSHRKALDQP